MIADFKKIEVWLAERKEAGKRIDPDNAEVACWYTYINDPYRKWPRPSDEGFWSGPSDLQCFARTPGGDDGWVWFDDFQRQRKMNWDGNWTRMRARKPVVVFGGSAKK